MSNQFLLKKIALILFFTSVAIFGLWFKYQLDINALKKIYVDEQTLELERKANLVEEKIDYVYQTIRTMSFVPGVRKIDRYAKNFDPDAKATVQQLFNNAYLNIKLSEIYILPSSLDPDQVDPQTGKPQEPITTFDEFIASGFGEPKSNEEKKPELEEVEIEEYRLMKEQLTYFKTSFPSKESFKDLDVPMISGKEVITCDNADFTQEMLNQKDNEKRKGLVLTVPVYGLEGHFRGGVSAVIRSEIIRQLLASADYSLVNKGYKYNSNLNPNLALKESEKYLSEGQTHPNYIFNSRRELKINDQSKWEIWGAKDNALFWSDSRVKKAREVFIYSLIGVVLVLSGLLYQSNKDYKLNFKINQYAYELQEKSKILASSAEQLSSSTAQFMQNAEQQSSAAQQSAASMSEIESMVLKTSESTRSMEVISQKGLHSCQSGQEALLAVLESIQQVEENQKSLESQVENNASSLRHIIKFIEDIGAKTKMINEIVFQTKLLSFNASVEAARAGENGKGFAVVAEEVGNLARVSGQSADEIVAALEKGTLEVQKLIQESTSVFEKVIQNISESVKSTSSRAEQCRVLFEGLLSDVNQIHMMTNSIASANKEQSLGIVESNKAVQTISDSTRTNALQTEELKKVSSLLHQQSEEIGRLVESLNKVFKNQ